MAVSMESQSQGDWKYLDALLKQSNQESSGGWFEYWDPCCASFPKTRIFCLLEQLGFLSLFFAPCRDSLSGFDFCQGLPGSFKVFTEVIGWNQQCYFLPPSWMRKSQSLTFLFYCVSMAFDFKVWCALEVSFKWFNGFCNFLVSIRKKGSEGAQKLNVGFVSFCDMRGKEPLLISLVEHWDVMCFHSYNF